MSGFSTTHLSPSGVAVVRRRDRSGRFAEEYRPETTLDLEVAPAGKPVAPLSAKPGDVVTFDAGRGVEDMVMLGATDVNGTRFLQAEGDGSLWEVRFVKDVATVVADPVDLERRAHLLASATRVGVRRRVETIRTSHGLGQVESMHLADCPQLYAPNRDDRWRVEVADWAKSSFDRGFGAQDGLCREAVAAQREAAEKLCDCIRLGESPR